MMHRSIHGAVAAERHRDMVAAAERARTAGPRRPSRPIQGLLAIARRRRPAHLRPQPQSP